jgi:hypothetical protein
LGHLGPVLQARKAEVVLAGGRVRWSFNRLQADGAVLAEGCLGWGLGRETPPDFVYVYRTLVDTAGTFAALARTQDFLEVLSVQ